MIELQIPIYLSICDLDLHPLDICDFLITSS